MVSDKSWESDEGVYFRANGESMFCGVVVTILFCAVLWGKINVWELVTVLFLLNYAVFLRYKLTNMIYDFLKSHVF